MCLLQEVNKGCDALLAQLESARIVVAASNPTSHADSRAPSKPPAATGAMAAAPAAAAAVGSPTRTRSKGGGALDSVDAAAALQAGAPPAAAAAPAAAANAASAALDAPEKVRRKERASAALADLQERVTLSKAQLADSIQGLSALVSKVRIPAASVTPPPPQNVVLAPAYHRTCYTIGGRYIYIYIYMHIYMHGQVLWQQNQPAGMCRMTTLSRMLSSLTAACRARRRRRRASAACCRCTHRSLACAASTAACCCGGWASSVA